MGLHPDDVDRLRGILARIRTIEREVVSLISDGSQGTGVVDGPCRRCSGRGVYHVNDSTGFASVPCSCAAGMLFRNAAAAQGRKQPRDEPAPRHLPNDANLVGRDRATGERE